MSGTREVPRGLDVLSPEEQQLMNSMRLDGPDMEPAPDPEPEPAPLAAEPEIEIDLPEEPDPEPEPAPAPTGRQKTVPHAQFHAAREEAKAAKKLAEERDAARIKAETDLATEKAVTQERLRILTELATPQAVQPTVAPVAEEEPLPDENTDPIGYFKGLAARQAKQIENVTAIARGTQEALQQERQIQEFRRWGESQELAFETREPTYRAAMDFLRKSRDAELESLGISDPTRRQSVIGQDVHNIAMMARQQGADFAERLYKQAVARGFVKVAPAATAAAPAAGETVVDGVVIPPMDAPVVAPAAVARAERIQEGRDNSLTIGSLGAAPPARMSVEKITNMTDKEFDALTTKLKAQGGDALRNLMGA